MNAGLPGTGLGGLFYLIGALWMPVSAIRGRIRGRRDIAWPVVLRQAGIAMGVFLALWLTGWGVGYLIVREEIAAAGAAGVPAIEASRMVTSVVHWVTLLGTTGLLALLIAAVQILRLVVPRELRPAAAGRPAAMPVMNVRTPDAVPSQEFGELELV